MAGRLNTKRSFYIVIEIMIAALAILHIIVYAFLTKGTHIFDSENEKLDDALYEVIIGMMIFLSTVELINVIFGCIGVARKSNFMTYLAGFISIGLLLGFFITLLIISLMDIIFIIVLYEVSLHFLIELAAGLLLIFIIFENKVTKVF